MIWARLLQAHGVTYTCASLVSMKHGEDSSRTRKLKPSTLQPTSRRAVLRTLYSRDIAFEYVTIISYDFMHVCEFSMLAARVGHDRMWVGHDHMCSASDLQPEACDSGQANRAHDCPLPHLLGKTTEPCICSSPDYVHAVELTLLPLKNLCSFFLCCLSSSSVVFALFLSSFLFSCHHCSFYIVFSLLCRLCFKF